MSGDPTCYPTPTMRVLAGMLAPHNGQTISALFPEDDEHSEPIPDKIITQAPSRFTWPETSRLYEHPIVVPDVLDPPDTGDTRIRPTIR